MAYVNPFGGITKSQLRRALQWRPSASSGWAGTGLEWRYDLGPINPLADQPAYEPGRWLVNDRNPLMKRLDIGRVLQSGRRINFKQGAPIREGYRKQVGRSIRVLVPAIGQDHEA